MTLPVEVQYGYVKCRAVKATPDTLDLEDKPDGAVVTGTVTITPSTPVLLSTSSTPPTMVFVPPQVYGFGSDGILRDKEGRSSLTLVADSPATNPQGWTYTATFQLAGGLTREPVVFHLAPGQTVDLVAAVSVPDSNGVFITKGDQGDPGEDGFGLAASEVDAEVADRISAPGSATRTALDSYTSLVGRTGSYDDLEDAPPAYTPDPVAAYLIGPRFAVRSATDWVPTVTGATRTVSVSAGSGIAAGARGTTSSAETVVFDANSSGAIRYDLVVQRFVWADGVATRTLQVVKGTAGAAPPTTRVLNPGVQIDGLIAIVRIANGASVLSSSDVTDARVWGGGSGGVVRATAVFLEYTDAIPGSEVLVLSNYGYGWQRYYYDGTVYKATRSFTLQATTFTATTLTSSAGTNAGAIVSIGVADPGYAYVLEVSATIALGANSGTQSQCGVRLDSVNGTALSADGLRSGGFPDGELVPMGLAPYDSGTLTGAHTVYGYMKRNLGSGSAVVVAAGNVLNVKVKPA